MGHMGGVLQISYLIKHGSDAYAMNDALLIACSRHSSQTGTPPSAWRRIVRIWGSLYLVIFIKISSDILPRKFYFRIPLVSGGLPNLGAGFALVYKQNRVRTTRYSVLFTVVTQTPLKFKPTGGG